MKRATVRDLRNNFARVSAWIEEGEPVELTKRGRVIARIIPAQLEKPRRFKMPDIMARLRATWGHQVFSAEETRALLRASRGERS